jgi:hypothetical protein
MCILSLFFVSAAVFAAEDNFVRLIPTNAVSWTENGKPLEGWGKHGGGATFTVKDGVLVGKFGSGIDTFLCTEKKYSDFILKFDVKFDVECNSGVQFRSLVQTKDKNELLVGYQCEINPEKDTANIFDENRRSRFLVAQKPELQAKIDRAFKKDGWNEVTIQCVGPSIKTWVNGEKITDLFDLESGEGILGFQVHSGERGLVCWRNIRIAEFPAAAWIPLFADKKFGAIEKKPVGKWEILEDGTLKGTTEKGQPKDGIIVSNESYKDFAVKVSFKMLSGNSGLYFRASEVNKPYWLKGFQCEIATDSATAGLWEVEGRGWVALNRKLVNEKFKKGNWNDLGTVAVGDRIATFLNGWEVVDIVDPKCAKEGKTALQLHGGGNQGCLFRDYYIMPLNEKAVELIKK